MYVNERTTRGRWRRRQLFVGPAVVVALAGIAPRAADAQERLCTCEDAPREEHDPGAISVGPAAPRGNGRRARRVRVRVCPPKPPHVETHRPMLMAILAIGSCTRIDPRQLRRVASFCGGSGLAMDQPFARRAGTRRSNFRSGSIPT